ncbi:MAG: molecular chaperone [Tenericutes bacterium HGW-Tenericutes-1]|jgi:hypothetical protein|nr:MAG: molecular chaperone [Tenericutes bacterium HGW-Tenericutes-1]
MKNIYNFERTEKKYLLSLTQFKSFIDKAGKHIEEDDFKEVTVHNIYFDNDIDLLIRHSISEPNFKEKLRVRGYNDLNQVYFEIKKKFDKVVYKRRVSITFDEIDNEYTFNHKHGQIENEIEYFIKKYNVVPKYYIGYKRMAYKDTGQCNLRITFDKDIVYRMNDLDLRSGFYGKHLLEDNQVIMEIKTNEAMPLWLVDVLNKLSIYPTSYSKVGNIYKKEFMKNKGVELWT